MTYRPTSSRLPWLRIGRTHMAAELISSHDFRLRLLGVSYFGSKCLPRCITIARFRPLESVLNESSDLFVIFSRKEGNFLSSIFIQPGIIRAWKCKRAVFFHTTWNIFVCTRKRSVAARKLAVGGKLAIDFCDLSYCSSRTYDDRPTSDESCNYVTFFLLRACPCPFIARRATRLRIFDEFNLAVRVRGSPHPRENFKVTH